MQLGRGRGRQMRGWEDLQADNQLAFMVGRMVGACEMSAQLLKDHEDPTAAHVAGVLGGISSWFLTPPGVIAMPDEQETLVRPPG